MKFEKIVFPGHRVELPGAHFLDPKYHWIVERPSGPKRAESEIRDNFLRGKPCCPICGERMTMRDGEYHTHYVCKAKHGKRQNYLSDTVLENVALKCLKDTLDRHTYDLEFQDNVRAEILEALAGFQASMGDWQVRSEEATRAYDIALDALTVKASKAVHKDLAKRADEALKRKQDAVASFERSKAIVASVGKLLTDLNARLRLMAEHLTRVNTSYPWKPTEPDEQKLRTDLAEMIKAVHVRVVGRSATAVFDLVLVKDAESDFEIVRRVEIDEPDVLSINDKTNKDRWLLAAAFEESEARITDAEFETLPPLDLSPKGRSNLRLDIDMMLVAADLGLEPVDLAYPLGKKEHISTVRVLRQRASFDAIVSHLRKTRGDDFDLPGTKPMPHAREVVRLAALRDPILLISNCDPKSGKTALDDDQWATIRSAFADSPVFFEMRRIIDAYFAIIRLGLPIAMAHTVGSTALEVRWLQKPFYRRAMANVVRLLLAREGYRLPKDYVRPRRAAGHTPNVEDYEAVIEQMRAAMPRCAPEGAIDQPEWFECPGLRFDLNSHEAFTDKGVPIRISPKQRALLACLLRAGGEVVPSATLRTVILQAGGVNEIKMLAVNASLRPWLRRECPYLAERLECEFNVGYRISVTPSHPKPKKKRARSRRT